MSVQVPAACQMRGTPLKIKLSTGAEILPNFSLCRGNDESVLSRETSHFFQINSSEAEGERQTEQKQMGKYRKMICLCELSVQWEFAASWMMKLEFIFCSLSDQHF